MSKRLPNGYYWYKEDGEPSEPCEVKPDGNYDVYFIGSEVGSMFDELDGTFEPLDPKTKTFADHRKSNLKEALAS